MKLKSNMLSMIKRSLSGGEESTSKKSKVERQCAVENSLSKSLSDSDIKEILPDAPDWSKSLLRFLHSDLIRITESIDEIKT